MVHRRKKLIHKDRAGNKLYLEGTKLAVRNKEGKVVKKSDARRFMKRKTVARSVKKFFGVPVRLKFV